MNKLAVAAALVTLTFASSSIAASMTEICNSGTFPCIRDSNGTIVGIGPVIPGIEPMRQIGGIWYVLNGTIKEDMGLPPSLQLFYTTPNCTGQGYAGSESVPRTAQYDGHAFFAPVGPLQEVTYLSFRYVVPPPFVTGDCQAAKCWDRVNQPIPCTVTGAPATKVGKDVTFSPPFKLQ